MKHKLLAICVLIGGLSAPLSAMDAAGGTTLPAYIKVHKGAAGGSELPSSLKARAQQQQRAEALEFLKAAADRGKQAAADRANLLASVVEASEKFRERDAVGRVSNMAAAEEFAESNQDLLRDIRRVGSRKADIQMLRAGEKLLRRARPSVASLLDPTNARSMSQYGQFSEYHAGDKSDLSRDQLVAMFGEEAVNRHAAKQDEMREQADAAAQAEANKWFFQKYPKSTAAGAVGTAALIAVLTDLIHAKIRKKESLSKKLLRKMGIIKSAPAMAAAAA